MRLLRFPKENDLGQTRVSAIRTGARFDRASMPSQQLMGWQGATFVTGIRATLMAPQGSASGSADLADTVMGFYERFPCGGDQVTHDDRWSRLPWMDEAFEPRDHIGQTVLDLGCGIGTDMQRFLESDARVVGVDFALRPLLHAMARLKAAPISGGWDLVRADARCLPFRSDVFDYFYSNGVLHHIPDHKRAIAEIRRCLRLGREGTVLVYHRRSLMTILTMLVRLIGLRKRSDTPPTRVFGANATAATRAGLAEVLHHPLIKYFSRKALKKEMFDEGLTTVSIKAYDWSFPLSRLIALKNSTILDRWFGRFLVARIRKLA